MNVNELPIETESHSVVTAGEHVLDSTVEVFETYQQRYDPDSQRIITTKPTTEPKPNAYTEYECSCGETFHDQTTALQHVLDET